MQGRFIDSIAPWALALLLAFAVPAWADDEAPGSGQQVEEEGEEPVARFLFEFNRGLDTILLRPIATFYKAFTPPEAQVGIRNFVNNVKSPMIALNDLLQGETERAGITLERALINTTTGWFGFTDPAKDEHGIEGHEEDFGQTLASWGVEDGPYMVLPVFGPSNPRDTIGMVVDFFTTPPVVGSVDLLDKRAQIDGELQVMEKTSLDYYSTVKSAYRQNRQFEINNRQEDGEEEDEEDLPTLE